MFARHLEPQSTSRGPWDGVVQMLASMSLVDDRGVVEEARPEDKSLTRRLEVIVAVSLPQE